jgi:hypothetical protein
MRSFNWKIFIRIIAIVLTFLLALGYLSTIRPQSVTNSPALTSDLPVPSPQPKGSSSTESSMSNQTPAPNGSGAPPSTIQPASAMGSSATTELDWRAVPVMPELSQRVFEIFRDGQAQGRNPHNFSVIGDCQAIPLVFLGPFERGELQPDSSESYLWDAIRQFKGSFSRTGMAVRGGFNAASILSPLQADPHYCLSGETPLTCEFRLQNPSIVYINLETWLDPKTIDRYEKYLRQILDYVIGKGSIPILMTKADAIELGNGTHVINPAVVRVARDYDVPLINFWRSAQSLENYGIDPNREGFHLSPEGYKLKNILALRTLYKVWTGVEQKNINPVDTPGTPTATPTVQTGPTSQTGLQPVIPDCVGGCIFLGTAVSHDGVVTSHGVLAFNYLTKKLTQILGEGFDLQDVSEDGQRLLVNNANTLYEINLADASTNLISGTFFSFGKQDAYWNRDDSQVIYIDQDHPIRTETDEAVNLFPSARDGEIYFEGGSCTLKANCQFSGVYHLDSTQTITRLDSYSQPVFSPNGKFVAFLDPSAATKENYYHIFYLLMEEVEQGIKSRRAFYFPEATGFMVNPDVREYAFSPDNNKLFIIYDIYSDYFERSLRIQTYIYDIQTRILSDYGKVVGANGSLNPRMVWAPQGNKILLFLTELTPDNQYSMSIYQTNLEAQEKLIPYAQGIITGKDYFYITNLYWR